MSNIWVWVFIWLGLIYLPRLLLLGTRWIAENRFLQINPDKAWLISSYKLVLIIWLPLSIISTARYFQTTHPEEFFLYVSFIPLIGLGLLKGIIEIIYGISWFWGIRLPEKLPFNFSIVIGPSRGLKMFKSHCISNRKHVKLAGIVRLLLNLGVLIVLIFLLG